MKSTQADREVHVSKNYNALTEEATKRILEISTRAIDEKGTFNFALSGGMAARGIYSMMASSNYRDEFDWNHIHLFWTDERWVSPTHARSNYGLVAEVLLTRVDIPIENIHPIRTNAKTPEISAICYEETLRSRLIRDEGQKVSFDLMLFELGKSGHIASIFSDHEALVEKDRLVTSVHSKDLYEDRVSVTLPLINQAAQILMVASGREKREILEMILRGSFNDDGFPAQLVCPQSGSVSWIVDEPAASLIEAA